MIAQIQRIKTDKANPAFKFRNGEVWRIGDRLLYAAGNNCELLRRRELAECRDLTDDEKGMAAVREYMTGRPRTMSDVLSEMAHDSKMSLARKQRVAHDVAVSDKNLCTYMAAANSGIYYVERVS